MFGAVYGDLAGSHYEWAENQAKKDGNIESRYNIRMSCLDPKTPLICEECFFTDDTILTVAVKEAILTGRAYYDTIKEFTREYYDIRGKYFGKAMREWAMSDECYYNNSFGNGSAMRCSPISYMFDSLDKVLEEAKNSAIPTHNSPEGIRGAQAIASVVYLARNGKSKEYIKEFVENNFYTLDYNLDDLQRNNAFTSQCEISVPQAIFVFLQSHDFENAIRLALSIGGDTDTIASMAGAMAEAYYGMDDKYKLEVYPYLNKRLIEILLK